MSTFPELPYAGTSGHSGGETSRDRAVEADSDGTTAHRQRSTMLILGRYGSRGVTVLDLRRITGWHHGQASSVLSVLHKTGYVERLTEKRDRCYVYVRPEYVDGRETQPHGRKVKACPHCGEAL